MATSESAFECKTEDVFELRKRSRFGENLERRMKFTARTSMESWYLGTSSSQKVTLRSQVSSMIMRLKTFFSPPPCFALNERTASFDTCSPFRMLGSGVRI